MGFFHLTLLAIFQGVTEFLPISSSGHLILLSNIIDGKDNLQFDISVHLGTLIAVIIFFREDVKKIIFGLIDNMNSDFNTYNSKFVRYIFVATIPVIIFGFILRFTDIIYELRTYLVIAISSIFFGIILFFADKFGKSQKNINNLNFKDSIIIGIGQSISLIPGSSRSGTTITFGRFLGYNRLTSSKISMIMSIPTILASCLLLIYDLFLLKYEHVNIYLLIYSSLISFITAFICLKVFFIFIQNHDFTIFVVYRCLLGIFIIIFIYI